MDDSFSKEYGEQLLGEGPRKLREAKDAFKIQDRHHRLAWSLWMMMSVDG